MGKIKRGRGKIKYFARDSVKSRIGLGVVSCARERETVSDVIGLLKI